MNTNAVANAMITKLNPISSGSEEDTDGIPKMLLVTGEGIAERQCLQVSLKYAQI